MLLVVLTASSQEDRSWHAQGIAFCASVLAYVCFPIFAGKLDKHGGPPRQWMRICQMPKADWQSPARLAITSPFLKSFSGQIGGIQTSKMIVEERG